MANNTGLKYSKLSTGGVADFTTMIQRFGVVTVMNAWVFNTKEFEDKTGKSFDNYYAEGSTKDYGNSADIAEWFLTEGTPICFLDTLKTANVTVEGPSKTITGGQYTNPLIKFGKTATLEIQDALGNAKAIEALCGGLVESELEPTPTTPYNGDPNDPTKPYNPIGAFYYGGDFEGEKTIIGESFFIDQKSGKQVPVTIIFYRFLPNSVFNLTQASDGDATVFDMNGDLLNTEVMVSTNVPGQPIKHGLFYAVLPRLNKGEVYVAPYTVTDNEITLTDATGIKNAYGNAIATEGTGSPTVAYSNGVFTVTMDGATKASVDIAIFYEDGSMKTYQNITVTPGE